MSARIANPRVFFNKEILILSNFHFIYRQILIAPICRLVSTSFTVDSPSKHLQSEDYPLRHVRLERNLNLRLNSIPPLQSCKGVYPPSSYQQVTCWRSWSNCMISDFSAQGNPNQHNLIRKSHKQEVEITNNHLSIVNSNGSPSYARVLVSKSPFFFLVLSMRFFFSFCLLFIDYAAVAAHDLLPLPSGQPLF